VTFGPAGRRVPTQTIPVTQQKQGDTTKTKKRIAHNPKRGNVTPAKESDHKAPGPEAKPALTTPDKPKTARDMFVDTQKEHIPWVNQYGSRSPARTTCTAPMRRIGTAT